jgi:hypothetical protein
MAGAVQATPREENDSGPTALNPGGSGAAPLIKEAEFLVRKGLSQTPPGAGIRGRNATAARYKRLSETG